MMDILYAEGEATVEGVRGKMVNEPTANAVRAMLQILEGKGEVKRWKRGREFVYAPAKERKRAGAGALEHVLDTFFEGSMEAALASHLAKRRQKMSGEEFDRLKGLIDAARKKS